MPRPKPLRTLSINLDQHILAAALPLLQAGEVDALEWSFDALDRLPGIPDWFADLLDVYARAGRLVGHGIYYSVCSAAWSEDQDRWLRNLGNWQQRFPLDHLTEHFGFMTGKDFHRGAPISPPLTGATLAVGRDRLLRLRQACGLPVGLENLALAYRADDVRRQGEFLDRLLAPVDGFILLDAHNLYCQAHNFGVDPIALCQAYPLERVREVHISGGSWEVHPAAPAGKVRRDTHNDRVPEAVFQILNYLLVNCPNLKYTTLEQLGPALKTDAERAGYAADFRRMSSTIDAATLRPAAAPKTFLAPAAAPDAAPYSDPALATQQQLLTRLLETSASVDSFARALLASDLAGTAWQVEHWQPHMLETVYRIAQKWA